MTFYTHHLKRAKFNEVKCTDINFDSIMRSETILDAFMTAQLSYFASAVTLSPQDLLKRCLLNFDKSSAKTEVIQYCTDWINTLTKVFQGDTTTHNSFAQQSLKDSSVIKNLFLPLLDQD